MINMLNVSDQTELLFAAAQTKTQMADGGRLRMARKKPAKAVHSEAVHSEAAHSKAAHSKPAGKAGPRRVPMREFSRSLPMSLLRAREAVMRHFRPSLRHHGLTAQPDAVVWNRAILGCSIISQPTFVIDGEDAASWRNVSTPTAA